MKNAFFFIACCILFSCLGKNKVPAGIIKPTEMQNILWDVIRAQALSAEIARKDSTVNEVAETKALSQKVFEIHNIKSADFDRSYTWYTNHPNMMLTIFDSLNNQIQRQNVIKIKEMNKPLKKDLIK